MVVVVLASTFFSLLIGLTSSFLAGAVTVDVGVAAGAGVVALGASAAKADTANNVTRVAINDFMISFL